MDIIARRDVQRLITSRLDMGKAPGTCDRMLILARHIFNCAIKWKIAGVKSNPAKEVELLNVDNKRERYLNEDEVRRLHAAVQASENPGPFMSLLGKVLPMQIAGDPDAPISISVSWLKPE
jgi:site-specific recombinase XerD